MDCDKVVAVFLATIGRMSIYPRCYCNMFIYELHAKGPNWWTLIGNNNNNTNNRNEDSISASRNNVNPNYATSGENDGSNVS